MSSGCIKTIDTINHIFDISCTMSADTNNISGIRGVLRRRKTLITVFFASPGYPIFPPSTPPPPSTLPPSPPSTPHRRRHRRQPHLRPRCRVVANPVTSSPSPFSTRRQPRRTAPSPSPFPRLESCHQAGASSVSIG
jgi:hypothetical protein